MEPPNDPKLARVMCGIKVPIVVIPTIAAWITILYLTIVQIDLEIIITVLNSSHVKLGCVRLSTAAQSTAFIFRLGIAPKLGRLHPGQLLSVRLF